MRKSVKLFNHVVEVRTSARHSWSHFKIHKRPMYKHLVWGRLSVIYGQPHLEEVGLCAQCGSPEVHEVQAGDEGLTHCPDCESIEGGYEYVTVEEAEKRGVL